jgi:hypothetical protein
MMLKEFRELSKIQIKEEPIVEEEKSNFED